MNSEPIYSVRKYKPNDEYQIISLLREVFDEWPKIDLECSPIDYWRWRYLDTPIKINNTVVAENEEKIIGTLHGTALNVKVGKNNYLGQVGSDAAVHPDFRRLGVYTNLSKLKSKMHEEYGYQILYWLTFNPIILNSHAWEEREVFSFTHPLTSLIRIHDVDSHLKYNSYKNHDLVLKYGYLGSKTINRIKYKKTSEEFNGIKVHEITRFDNTINAFWETVKQHYVFSVNKTDDYLNWRYCDNRGGEYRVLLAREDGKILGYCVYKINHFIKEYPVGYIIEVLAFPNREDVVKTLIDEALKRLDSMKINVVHAKTVKENSYENIFKQFGFVDALKKTYVNFCPVNIGEDLEKFVKASPDLINFQYGDVEQF